MSPRATHFFLFSAFILSCSSFAFSRPLDQQSGKTSVFNLSASIQRRNEILSSTPETIARQQSEQPQKHSTKSSSSSLSLKLYSRDALRSPPFKSYGELVLSRTQREKARLNFIYNKLNGNSSSSSDSSFTPVDLQAPLYSGVPSLHLGEYVAQLGFGTPSQQVHAIIDTGSDITYVPCSGSIFDPSASQTYKVLTCDAPSCQELDQTNHGGCSDQNSCQYHVHYGDNSSTTGDFATDTLHFGDTAIPDSPFGCDAQTTDSYGLLGLGRGSLSFPSLQQASSFSYCLLDRDSRAPSTLEVGSVDIPSGAVTTPLLKSDSHTSFYYVGLTGISVGGARLQIPASAFEINPRTGGGGVIIDSGTTLTYFFPEIYDPLSEAFAESVTQADQVVGSGLCYRLTSELNDLPIIEFHFGEQTLSFSANTYLVRNELNVHCFAFKSQNPKLPVSIIGNVQQQELLVTYDLEGSKIGFTKKPNCQG